MPLLPSLTILRVAAISTALSLIAAGCASSQKSIVELPLQPSPSLPPNIDTSGSIYQSQTALLLYETPRARRAGDVLTIRLAESWSGNDALDTDGSRTGGVKSTDSQTNTTGLLAKWFGLANTSFKGNGNIRNSVGMNGTFTVSVIGTTSGGNLVVAGERVIAIGANQEHLRLSGIVDPKDIELGNYVWSGKVANARIEQSGTGTISKVTTFNCSGLLSTC